MSRSLKVAKENIKPVKLALKRNNFRSQNALAEDLRISRSTVVNFLNGKPVDFANFEDICQKLALDWQEIADLDSFEKEEPGDDCPKPGEELPETSSNAYSTFPDYSDFYGRESELEEFEKMVRESRVVAMCGEPGVGKTYIAAELAKRLSQDYKICWIDKEGLTLDELLLQVNEFLNANGEKGFITTYSKEKEAGINIPIQSKVATLVEVIQTSKRVKSGYPEKYLFFIDNFQQAHHPEIKHFVERFRTNGGESRVVLIGHSPSKSLGGLLAAKVQQFPVEGFQEKDAFNYINRLLCQNSGVKCSPQDVTQLIETTAGHPLAIELVIIWLCQLGGSIENVLNRLIDYDKQDGAELRRRLLEDVATNLDDEERNALCRLSIFRTSLQSSSKTYLDISENVWNSLLQHRLLKSVGSDNFRIHPLIATFWRNSQSKEEIVPWHEKAARYYWEQGKKSLVKDLDRRSYLESHYHWQQIDRLAEAAQVLNDLIYRIHEKERLPSDRLPGLKTWLFQLDDAVFEDKPWLLLEKGRKLEKQGKIKEAQQIFRQAYQVFQQEPKNLDEQESKNLGTSVALYYVGKMHYLIRQYEPALADLESVLEMANSRSDRPMQIRTLGKMVSCYTELVQDQKAQNCAARAEKLARHSNDQLGLALALYRQGSIKRHQSNFSEAEKYFSESAKTFKELGDIYRESKSLVRLAICQQFQGKYEQAKKNLKLAIELKKSINDLHGLARDLDYLADIYSCLGFDDKAKAYYKNSLTFKEGDAGIQRDEYGIIKTYNNLARLTLSTNHLDEANEWLQKSKELIEQQNKRPIGVDGSRLIIQGDWYFTKGEYESALQSYKDAIACFTSPNPNVPHSFARVLLSLGITYLTIGNLELAKQNLETSYNNFKNYKMDYHQGLALTYLARLKALICPLEELEEAEKLNNDAMTIAKDIEPVLAVIFETRGMIEEKKFLHSFSLEGINVNVDDKNQLGKIEKVWSFYDQAIEKFEKRQAFLNIARLKVKKHLWHFIIKHFYQTPISSDNAYGLLKSEKFVAEAIQIELLNAKYHLSILNSISSTLASKIADYSLNILSPLAIRFGLNELREELEDQAFAFLKPIEYQEIVEWLEKKFPQRDELIEEVNLELEIALADAKITPEPEIYPRIKSIYSIYKKLTARQVSLDKILDVVGFRIITETEEECYKVLTVVQKLGSYFQGKGILQESLRDYIKYPKKNTGYQSIHINILSGESEPQIIEFQIRTSSMHLAAEYGISILGLGQVAHSYYKEQTRYSRPSSKKNYELAQRPRVKLIIECNSESVLSVRKILNNSQFELLSLDDINKSPENKIILKLELVTKSSRLGKESKELKDAIERLIFELNQEALKVSIIENNVNDSEIKIIDLSFEEKASLIQELTSHSIDVNKFIYVITPKGDVKKLLQGATCVDFAYSIHEEVGNCCSGAKVNNQMVTLDTSLKNGDIVEVITQKNHHPSLDWLNFVVTDRARHRIRQWYKRAHWENNVVSGRELLQKELGKNGFEALLESESMQTVVEQCNYQSVDALLAALGYGEVSVIMVANRIREIRKPQQPIENSSYSSNLLNTKSQKTSSPSKSPINGIEGMVYRLAHCCNPLPGEPIIGILPRDSRCISIHSQECPNWKNSAVERRISVSWNPTEGKTYLVDIQIEVIDRIGVLEKILHNLSKANINVRKADVKTYPNQTAIINLCLDICNYQQFQYVEDSIKKMKEYIKLLRISPTE